LKSVRGQSGVEVLVSYGWVVVVAVVGVFLLNQMGVFKPIPCERNKIAFSEVVPLDWGVYVGSNSVVMQVENYAGEDVVITGVNVSSLRGVECVQDMLGVSLGSGERTVLIVNCSVNPSVPDRFLVGECYWSEVSIAYFNTILEESYRSSGRLSGPVEQGVGAVSAVITTNVAATTVAVTTTTTTLDFELPPVVELIEPIDGTVI
jgi:hypothetical protein